MKKYYFDIPAKLTYTVEAETEEKAKKKLIEKGGFDITYDEVLVEKQDYENAECIE